MKLDFQQIKESVYRHRLPVAGVGVVCLLGFGACGALLAGRISGLGSSFPGAGAFDLFSKAFPIFGLGIASRAPGSVGGEEKPATLPWSLDAKGTGQAPDKPVEAGPIPGQTPASVGGGEGGEGLAPVQDPDVPEDQLAKENGGRRAPGGQRVRRRAASRAALNSAPGFHSGQASDYAARQPTARSKAASSTAPLRSQSGSTSSEGLW